MWASCSDSQAASYTRKNSQSCSYRDLPLYILSKMRNNAELTNIFPLSFSYTILDFVDSCLFSWGFLFSKYTSCILGFFFLFNKILLLIKKELCSSNGAEDTILVQLSKETLWIPNENVIMQLQVSPTNKCYQSPSIKVFKSIMATLKENNQ